MVDKIQEGVSGMKTLYYNRAEGYPGWKDKTRSQLCMEYVDLKEANDPKAEYCFAGIVYKFWNLITHNYYKQQIRIASEEDCLTWVIDAIMFVLDQHVWTIPDHKLYQDSDAPEKCVNILVMNNKINFFVAQNRQKRKINSRAQSIDSMVEDGIADAHVPYVETEYNYLRDIFGDIVRGFFSEKDYLSAFIFDIMLTYPDVIKDPSGTNWEVNTKEIQKALSNLDSKFIESFSKKYKIRKPVVDNAVMMLYYVSAGASLAEINKSIMRIRSNPEIVHIHEEE